MPKIDHSMATVQPHTDKQQASFVQSSQSRLANPSQNKKRGRATAQKATAPLPHILFCPIAPHTQQFYIHFKF